MGGTSVAPSSGSHYHFLLGTKIVIHRSLHFLILLKFLIPLICFPLTHPLSNARGTDLSKVAPSNGGHTNFDSSGPSGSFCSSFLFLFSFFFFLFSFRFFLFLLTPLVLRSACLYTFLFPLFSFFLFFSFRNFCNLISIFSLFFLCPFPSYLVLVSCFLSVRFHSLSFVITLFRTVPPFPLPSLRATHHTPRGQRWYNVFRPHYKNQFFLHRRYRNIYKLILPGPRTSSSGTTIEEIRPLHEAIVWATTRVAVEPHHT